MKIIVILLLLFPLLSCDKEFLDEPIQSVKKLKTTTLSVYPFIIDGRHMEKRLLKQQPYLETGNYNPLYIGLIADTLSLNYSSVFEEYFLYESKQEFPYWGDTNLSIGIATVY